MPRPRVRPRRLQAPTVLLGTASVLTATVLSACGGVSAGDDDDAGGEGVVHHHDGVRAGR